MTFKLKSLNFLPITILLVSLNANAVISIMTKDPLSTDTGVALITSGQINDRWLPILTPALKNVGLTSWGGDASGFSISDSLSALGLIAQGAKELEIINYIYNGRPHTDYRFSIMSKSGHITAALAPDCDFGHGCGYLVDPVRKIIVSGGGQEPDVIRETFARIQEIHDYRIAKFKQGLEVEPFSCYLANMLTVSQEFGGERFRLKTASITLDLETRAEILRTFSGSEYEAKVVTELKNKMNTEFQINCK